MRLIAPAGIRISPNMSKDMFINLGFNLKSSMDLLAIQQTKLHRHLKKLKTDLATLDKKLREQKPVLSTIDDSVVTDAE